MTDEEYVEAFVRLRSKTNGEWFVHPDLRPRLVADAREQGTNLTEVAIQILSERYGVPFAPTGRRADPRPDDDKIVLALPRPLFAAITLAHPRRYQDGLRASLCAHYGLDVPAKARRTRAPRAAAA